MRINREMAFLLLAAAFVAGLGRAQEKPDPAQGPVLRYIGVKGCASCHKSKATGNQIEAWKATAHARAYQTLATAEAREVAKKLGIDKDPQEVPRCLGCHTTAAGELKSRLSEDFDLSEGVQCEACHGPGSEYSKIQHMIKHEVAIQMGLQAPKATTCKRCHNEESPTFKGFDYAAALKKIAHPLAPL
jgi:hypothetical protein